MARSSAPAARAPSAMRAAPVLIGSIWARSWVVPSGKMATTSRSARARWHSTKASSLPLLRRRPCPTCRCTNTTPALRSSSPRDRDRPQPGLGDEAGQAAERGRDQHRVDEAVEVVGHQQHGPPVGVPLDPGHLDPAEQEPRGEARDPRDDPPHRGTLVVTLGLVLVGRQSRRMLDERDPAVAHDVDEERSLTSEGRCRRTELQEPACRP